MSESGTAREALIAEAIGDVGRLLARLETVAPSLDQARVTLLQVSTSLADQAMALDRRMATVAENAKTQAVQHIVRRTEEAARRALEAHTRAMAEAARQAFEAQAGATLRRLVAPLGQLSELAAHPWRRWLTHAATAASASAITWALTIWFVTS